MFDREPNATNHQIKALQKLASDGAKLMEAAEAMGWDFRRVQYWEKRLAIRFQRGRRKVISAHEEARFRNLVDQGRSVYAIATDMRWHHQKVIYWEKSLGLKVRGVNRKHKNGRRV